MDKTACRSTGWAPSKIQGKKRAEPRMPTALAVAFPKVSNSSSLRASSITGKTPLLFVVEVGAQMRPHFYDLPGQFLSGRLPAGSGERGEPFVDVLRIWLEACVLGFHLLQHCQLLVPAGKLGAHQRP